jgi:Ca2+-binding EF-hand superfamily protein
MNEFTQVYRHFSGAQNQDSQQISCTFCAFNRDGLGTLSIDEFLSAICIINHTIP